MVVTRGGEEMFWVLEIEETVPYDWKAGEADIVELVDEWFVENLATEC